jgi:hypothetical protein
VVKSVDALMALERGICDGKACLVRKEPYRICKIIDILWRAHMSSPNKYALDCGFRLLIYRTHCRGTHTVSTVRKGAIFDFENQFLRMIHLII